jgi:hypothetical protein
MGRLTLITIDIWKGKLKDWNEWESTFNTLFHSTFQHLPYPKLKNRKLFPSLANKYKNSSRQKKEKWGDEIKKKKTIGFDLGFILILWCGFDQNHNILLQQHWPQGLQIGLPSWYVSSFCLEVKSGL